MLSSITTERQGYCARVVAGMLADWHYLNLSSNVEVNDYVYTKTLAVCYYNEFNLRVGRSFPLVVEMEDKASG